ncbi:MAG: hypothetical protein WBG92_04040 [Thiohalocapsa sp.]
MIRSALETLLHRYTLSVHNIADDAPIPGSYWGEQEAGLIGDRLYLRADTPLHSVLHEACHFVCIDETRRDRLHTDAGGDYAEEDAVCYLQIVLADQLPGIGRDRMCADMDAWGYSFRLGSAKAWFERDAEDARAWLVDNALLNPDGTPTWALRR